MQAKLTIREMTLIALFSALTAVGAFIKVPTPTVPFTLQFLFCAYAGLFLGAKNALYSQLLYIFIGLAGIPVFTGGGGPAYIFQPTFGYLVGFACCSYLIGKAVEHTLQIRFKTIFATILGGLSIVYLFGVAYLHVILNFYIGKEVTLLQTLWLGFLPYIAFDVLQSAFIAFTAVKIIPILKNSGYLPLPRKS